MGKFEEHILDYIGLCNKEIRRLGRENEALYHDCSCNFCDREGDITDDDWPEHKRLLKEIEERETLIKSLEGHAKLHGIALEVK